MDRAQRQRKTSEEFGTRAQALLQQVATTSLPQEAQLAALDQQSQQLADAERTQSGYRRLRERYDPAELARSLQSIAAIADPVQQRASLTQLQGSYAGFAFSPEIARRMDRQFAEFEPVVQRREQAALLQGILAGRYAPTLSDARQTYPGRKINTLVDPDSRATFFVPDKVADPDLEAEAVHVIQNAFHRARLTGDRTHFEAALDDPAVRQVSRIPGNQASVAYRQRLESLILSPAVPTASFSEAPAIPDALISSAQTVEGENPQVTADTPGRGDNPGTRPIVDMAGRLLRRTNDLEKDDLKRVFLQTQHDILLGLARREWSPEGAKWLNDVVTRFMDPLFDALDGRPNAGWRSTLDELDKVRYYRRYVGLFPDSASQYHVRALEIYAARKMALTHILQDLDSALRSAGKGTDADWRTLGAIVKHSQGRFFSAEENIASLLGGMFVSPTLDVGKLRDVMRDSIEQ